MVSTGRERGQGNPDLGSTLRRTGYLQRSAAIENEEMRPNPWSRVRYGKWTLPAEIAASTQIQWTQNATKIKECITQAKASHLKPWGTFSKLGGGDLTRKSVIKRNFQNIRGINSHTHDAYFDLRLQSMMSIESDISLLTELNLTAKGTRNHTRIANDVSPQSKLIQHHPLQEDSNLLIFKKGGHCAWLQPHIARRLKETHKDIHGRWIAMELASPASTLTVVTVCRVCRDSGAPVSGSIAARERRSLMRSQHDQARDPRKAFLTDLTLCLRNATGKGHKLLICMDANTPWNHKDIQQLKRDVGLTDLMQAANSNIPLPATYDRGDEGKGPIDLALGCRATASALLTAGFHEFYHLNWTDHRLGELSFDKMALMGPKDPPLTQPPRALNLLYPKHTNAYKKKLRSLLKKSKTKENLEKIENLLKSEDTNIRSEGIRRAIILMDRASAYMTLSKDTAVPKVP